MVEDVIYFRSGLVNLEKVRSEWRRAIRPIIILDEKNAPAGPELEEDTDKRYGICRAIIERLLNASVNPRQNLYAFARRLIAQVGNPHERMMLAQDYVTIATERKMYNAALDICTPKFFPAPAAHFDACAHVLARHLAFQNKWYFVRLRRLAEAIKNSDIDPEARTAAWKEVFGLTKHADDLQRLFAEQRLAVKISCAVPQRERRMLA